MFKLISLLSLLSLSSSIKSFTYSSCGKTGDLASNVKLDISPKLPEIDYILYLDADLSTEITGGTSKYTTKYNFLPLAPTINDLCSEISNSNITCPLNQYIASESKGTIPSGLSGIFTIINEWFNQENKRILCMRFDIQS